MLKKDRTPEGQKVLDEFHGMPVGDCYGDVLEAKELMAVEIHHLRTENTKLWTHNTKLLATNARLMAALEWINSHFPAPDTQAMRLVRAANEALSSEASQDLACIREAIDWIDTLDWYERDSFTEKTADEMVATLRERFGDSK